MVGRDLLKTGVGWAIGSGTDVNVWSEPWMSTSEPLTPTGPPTSANQNWRVN